MSFLSKITLPDGSTYDLRDNKAGHYLGTSTTTISAGTISGTIVVNGTTYSLNPTGSQVALRDQDIVKDNADLLYIAIVSGNTGSKTGTWVALTTAATMSITDVKVDNTSVLDGTVAKIATTGSLTGGTAYNATTNPLATKAYVDELPEPMIFKGGIKLTADSSDTTKVSISDGSGQALSNVKEGYTYKVTNIASSPTYTGTLKLGDTFIADKDSPVTTIAWVEGTDWTIIPSGDEPSGTVTNVAAGVGLTTASGSAITETGTIKAKLTSETALTGDGVASVGVDSNGNLAVDIRVVDGTYNASTNKVATQSTVTNAINDLDVTGDSGIDASKTISAWSEENGKVSISTQNISISVSQVNDVTATTTIHNPTAATVVTGVAAANASSTAAEGAITYYTYDNATETLTLKQITVATGDSITTSDVSNVVVKTSSGT